MPKIQMLPKAVSELIAAGEVVERPASVIKELVENAVDAGAGTVTVEIRDGGVTYMRISDNGCGISRSDVPLAFQRHATSKIRTEEDLYDIHTLGFRGEALAAVAGVARVELYTKTADEEFGTHYRIEGGEETFCEEEGCADGTTILVRDLFFNTPARMKFLKKDVSEGNAVSAVMERAAMSHPEIAFHFIKDGKQMFSTAGDGNLRAAVYSILGREFANALIPVSYESGALRVQGLITKPVHCKKSRNYQFTFLNQRFVKSATVVAAVEQAYKNSAMVGKFPGFVLNVSVPAPMVDVNVHPAKIEVRFADEKQIFSAVYAAAVGALRAGDTRPELSVGKQEASLPLEPEDTPAKEPQPEIAVRSPITAAPDFEYRLRDGEKPVFMQGDAVFNKPTDLERNYLGSAPKANRSDRGVSSPRQTFSDAPDVSREEPEVSSADPPRSPEPEPPVRLIGEAFRTYIIVQKGDSIFMIDKHAAHERILFNRLKKEARAGVQVLLSPVRVTLAKEEYDALVQNLTLLEESGFLAEDFGDGCILVREVPANLTDRDMEDLMSEIAVGLRSSASVQVERLDHIYHSVACKAAIKAGAVTSGAELLQLAEQVLLDRDVMYCPHGRPVAFELKRKELEKQFGRIQ